MLVMGWGYEDTLRLKLEALIRPLNNGYYSEWEFGKGWEGFGWAALNALPQQG